MKHSSGPSPDWLTLRTHSHHHFVFVWSKTCRLIVSMHPLYCNSDLYVMTGCGGVLEYRFKRRCSSFFFSFFFLLNTLLFRHSQLLVNIILFVKGNAAESSDYLGKFLKARIHIVLCTKSTFHSSSRLLSDTVWQMVCEASKYMTFSKVEDNFHMEAKEPDYDVEYIPELKNSEI